ncbi:uncharacterized protein Dwil_GK11458 [Drosophila willistoni]|uniref:Ig-like domain-containing protein n=2 Tax=Drosophila willistoni TaxID=7260 RepID=B4N9S5_DROWI|nr:uncharacterized protein Dwil_GK11458 [Drosophila willistoni]
MQNHHASGNNMLPSTDTAATLTTTTTTMTRLATNMGTLSTKAAAMRRCRGIPVSTVSTTPTLRGITSIPARIHRSNSSSSSILPFQMPHLLLLVLMLLLLLCVLCDAAQGTLRDVNLLVQPPAVRRGQSVALHCNYQLEGAPLYSIKFYRGQMEFYRFTPGEYPNTKVFQYPGIRVDEGSSNATLVYIRNVTFGLSGQFSCEVTADAPLYSTSMAYAQMQVVEFPEKRPQLFTEQTRYEPGDVLRANCSTLPSRPKAELRFTINNVPVYTEATQYIRTTDNLIASRLSLKLQLQAVHFVAGINANIQTSNALGIGSGKGTAVSGGGALLLRCTAQIGDLYQEYKEIELGTPQKDPVPARVTLSSGTGLQNFLETFFYTSTADQRSYQPLGLLSIILMQILKIF